LLPLLLCARPLELRMAGVVAVTGAFVVLNLVATRITQFRGQRR
jgi:hypothetical protein